MSLHQKLENKGDSMKLNIINKILISILLLVILMLVIDTYTVKALDLTEIQQSADDFLNKGDIKLDRDALDNTSNVFYKILLTIGIIVAVIVGMVIGIKLMIASADEKAKVKELLMPYIAGCIVVFGAFGIWKIVINTGNKIEGNIGNNLEKNIRVTGESLTWTHAADAKEYIDNGGDLTTVQEDELLQWYGQLSRQSRNNGRLTDYYNQVREETLRRGIYCRNCGHALTDSERSNKKCEECGTSIK